MTTVKLLKVNGLAIEVEGLDAIDGTLVIDIKPYYPPYDIPKGEVKVPDWIYNLRY